MEKPEMSEVGIWVIDADARTEFANRNMAEILGTSVSEMIGKPSFNFVFPEDLKAASKLFEAKKNGKIDRFHFRLRRQDGSAVAVDVQGTPKHSTDGVFTGIIGTFTVLG